MTGSRLSSIVDVIMAAVVFPLDGGGVRCITGRAAAIVETGAVDDVVLSDPVGLKRLGGNKDRELQHGTGPATVGGRGKKGDG